MADLERREPSAGIQRAKLDLLGTLNKGVVNRFGAASEVEAAARNYELAFRMQSAVPNLLELSGESQATRNLYGLDETDT
jgi:Protein of unknown function (DUF1501)